MLKYYFIHKNLQKYVPNGCVTLSCHLNSHGINTEVCGRGGSEGGWGEEKVFKGFFKARHLETEDIIHIM